MATTKGFDSVIGDGLIVKWGTLEGNNVRIEGRVESPVNIDGKVLVGDTGVVIGDITAQGVIISGHVVGDVRAHAVSLMATAIVVGNIAAFEFDTQVGCRLNGQVVMKTEVDLVDTNEEIDIPNENTYGTE